jgi:hypothetical protein
VHGQDARATIIKSAFIRVHSRFQTRRRRWLGAFAALLVACAWARPAQPGERLETDYYRAEITAQGNLDFHALPGARVAAGVAHFRARYFWAGAYLELNSAASTGDIVERQDSILLSFPQRVGPVRLTCQYILVRSSPCVECRYVLAYTDDIDSVFSEELEFTICARDAKVVGRDQQFERLPVERPLTVIDRWTTRAAEFGEGMEAVTLPGEDNLLGLRVKPENGEWQILGDIDQARYHPLFRDYRWNPPAAYDTLAATGRRSGTSREAYFRMCVGRPIRILKRERQPDGYEATLVMTEHADCEGPATTRAIAYGSSELDAPSPGRGILGNGLTWTKAIFRWSTAGSRYANLGRSGLDDPDFKQIVDQLFNQGVEIALHSPTALPDSAHRVGTALRDLRSWYQSKVWIDHGMDVNWEALAKFGSFPESLPWFILDTLRAYGFCYNWLAIDLPAVGYWGNSVFASPWPGWYPLVLYPLPGRESRESGLYLWRTLVVNANSARDGYLSPTGIEQLLASRGVCILHLYFASQDTYIGRSRPTDATWLIPHGQPPNMTWETDPKVDAYFRNMAAQKKAGRLRVTTLSDFADYLLLSDSVTIRAQGNEDYRLTNHALRPVPGFALAVAADGVERITLDGIEATRREVSGQKRVGSDILFWIDVPADTTMTIHLATRAKVSIAATPNPGLGLRSSAPARLFWQVEQAGKVEVSVFSAAGRLIRNVYQGWCPAGSYEVTWDGQGRRGQAVPAGSYFCRVQSGNASAAVKLVIAR